MSECSDQQRLNSALLHVLGISNIVHDTGELTHPVAIEYAEAVRGFRDYTMECLERMRPPTLRSVD